MSKLRKEYYDLVSFELNDYDRKREEINEIREAVIFRPPMAVGEQERVMGGEISNPTQAKGMKLVTNTSLKYNEWVVKAIDRALEELDDTHREIFRLHYRQKKEWKQCLSEMYISQTHFFRKRRELVIKVAIHMGLIQP